MQSNNATEYDFLDRELGRKLRRAGCFARRPLSHWRDAAIVLSLYSWGYVTLLNDPEWPARLLALFLLAFSSIQAGFIGHEAGHGAITASRRLATIIGQFFDSFLIALSYSHFQDIHRRHHPFCNDKQRDPDIQGAGVFSLYQESAFEKRGLGKFVTKYQHVLIWLLVSLQGFTLKRDSVQCLLRNPRGTRFDQIALLGHFVLWFGPPVVILGPTDSIINYAIMTWFGGPYLGMIFIPNHTGMPTTSEHAKTSFMYQQLHTTRNLGTSRFEDFVFGGLNNHIEHHLFPAMPTCNLRKARGITRDFCQRHGLPYHETSWIAGAAEVATHLKNVSLNMVRSAASRQV